MKQKRKQLSVVSRSQLLALKKKWPLGYPDLRRWRYHPVYNVSSTRRKKIASVQQQKDEECIPEWVPSLMKEKPETSSVSNILHYKEVECGTPHKKLPNKKSSAASVLKKTVARSNLKEPVHVEGSTESEKTEDDSKTCPGSLKDSDFKLQCRKKVTGENIKTEQCISKLSTKEGGPLEKDEGGSSATVVILKSCKRKRSRTRALQCSATATSIDCKQKRKCSHFHRRRHSYFMMCKTFSLVPLYHNIKCQKIRKRRNKFKQQLNECRYTGISGNFQERLDYRGAGTNVVSYLESEAKTTCKGLKHPLSLSVVNKSLELKEPHLSRFLLNGRLDMFQHSEMNFSGIGPEQETLSIDRNKSPSPKWTWGKNMECKDANSLHSEQGSDGPVEDSCDSEPYLDEMYFDEVPSPVNMDVTMDTECNPESSLQGTSSNIGSNKLELNEEAQNCTPMEIDHVKNTDIFTTELLDHLYCKSPHEEPMSVNMKCRLESDLRKKEDKGIKSSVHAEQLTTCINDFLDEFLKKYGSLIPLCEKDIMTRLKQVFNEDFSNRRSLIIGEIMKYRKSQKKNSMNHFQVNYNKHVLEVDDLTTLAGQNWLNDQIINMYGELIMDAVPDTVHFFNSFFHKQLVTRGYNGVKRWTKKVELFKKKLLLIPIHLEVHWSLITVDILKKIISFYDSQGIHFKFCVENIRKYLYTEAKEKNHPEFLDGWQTTITKCIPQQKNSSDCGVFVLQYCKCLALGQPFQFSQEDMPRVRRRIYKELCECKLMD